MDDHACHEIKLYVTCVLKDTFKIYVVVIIGVKLRKYVQYKLYDLILYFFLIYTFIRPNIFRDKIYSTK